MKSPSGATPKCCRALESSLQLALHGGDDYECSSCSMEDGQRSAEEFDSVALTPNWQNHGKPWRENVGRNGHERQLVAGGWDPSENAVKVAQIFICIGIFSGQIGTILPDSVLADFETGQIRSCEQLQLFKQTRTLDCSCKQGLPPSTQSSSLD